MKDYNIEQERFEEISKELLEVDMTSEYEAFEVCPSCEKRVHYTGLHMDGSMVTGFHCPCGYEEEYAYPEEKW